MRDLTYYLINPFANKNISLDNKKKFGEDHIKRIASLNTGNIFDTILNDSIAVQTALFGQINSVATNFAIQQSRTKSVDNIIASFTSRNTRLNNYFIATQVTGQPVYQEFFPLGVQAFTTFIDKGNVEQRMQQMVDAITNNTTIAGGTGVLTEYSGFLSSYHTARGQQLDKIAAVGTGIRTRNETEADWDDQMFENLLTFANLNRNQPQILGSFMNQSILQAQTSAANDGLGRGAGIITSGGNPLINARVHVIDGKINDAFTAEDGSYTTQNLPIGIYTIQFSKEGYTALSVTIEIVDDGDTLHDAVLAAA